ncbi:MAG: hypothetical protein ACJAZO_002299 [Myxococcota bacterium]|jgi:hypothetical protein
MKRPKPRPKPPKVLQPLQRAQAIWPLTPHTLPETQLKVLPQPLVTPHTLPETQRMLMETPQSQLWKVMNKPQLSPHMRARA